MNYRIERSYKFNGASGVFETVRHAGFMSRLAAQAVIRDADGFRAEQRSYPARANQRIGCKSDPFLGDTRQGRSLLRGTDTGCNARIATMQSIHPAAFTQSQEATGAARTPGFRDWKPWV